MRKEQFVVAALIALCVSLVVPAMAKEGDHSKMTSEPVTVVVSHRVANFAAWEKVFEGHASMREKAGCTGMVVYQAIGEPNYVTVIGTFVSAEQAKDFFTSEDLKAAMEKAGVQGPPEIRILEPYKEYQH